MALVAEAEAVIETLTIDQAIERHGSDDAVFIDLRDIREVAKTGKVKDAHHVPRGMLEFWIDPESPYHKDFFSEEKQFIFYCAGGWRSALAGKTAHDLGLRPVAHLAGGMKAWLDAEAPLDPPRNNKTK